MDQAQLGIVVLLKIQLKPWYVEESGAAREDLQVIHCTLSVQSIATVNNTCMYVYDTSCHTGQEAVNDKKLFK